jgi:hypothetical protein
LDYTVRNIAFRAKDLQEELDKITPRNLKEHLKGILLKPTKSTLVMAGNFTREVS